MLVQLADFFDTSVDALIGYTIKDNRRDATLARLMDLRHAKDLRGVDEAERAVMRYPNCFAIVYQAAVMMQVFGLEQSDKALTARALELYERALLLTEQNTNSEISELTIHVAMAECDLMLGRKEKALETLKANNPMGLNNMMIGMWAITHCDRAEEAENYLSRALLENVSRLFTMTMGFLTLYEKQKRWNEARELARWMLAICEGLVRADEPSSMVKSCAMMAACVGVTERGAGDDAAARRALGLIRMVIVWIAGIASGLILIGLIQVSVFVFCHKNFLSFADCRLRSFKQTHFFRRLFGFPSIALAEVIPTEHLA